MTKLWRVLISFVIASSLVVAGILAVPAQTTEAATQLVAFDVPATITECVIDIYHFKIKVVPPIGPGQNGQYVTATLDYYDGFGAHVAQHVIGPIWVGVGQHMETWDYYYYPATAAGPDGEVTLTATGGIFDSRTFTIQDYSPGC